MTCTTAQPPLHTSNEPDGLEALLGTLLPIALDELVEQAAMQTRVDRKYVLPTSSLAGVVAALPGTARALEIDWRRSFGYRSVYLDTPTLESFHAGGQGRRRRFKVRSRTYLDSGSCWLEVKTRPGGA
jgi:hypothetical protein